MYQTAYREKINMFLMDIHLELKGLNHLIGHIWMENIYEIHKRYGDGDLTKFDNFYISDIIKPKIIAE